MITPSCTPFAFFLAISLPLLSLDAEALAVAPPRYTPIELPPTQLFPTPSAFIPVSLRDDGTILGAGFGLETDNCASATATTPCLVLLDPVTNTFLDFPDYNDVMASWSPEDKAAGDYILISDALINPIAGTRVSVDRNLSVNDLNSSGLLLVDDDVIGADRHYVLNPFTGASSDIFPSFCTGVGTQYTYTGFVDSAILGENGNVAGTYFSWNGDIPGQLLGTPCEDSSQCDDGNYCNGFEYCRCLGNAHLSGCPYGFGPSNCDCAPGGVIEPPCPEPPSQCPDFGECGSDLPPCEEDPQPGPPQPCCRFGECRQQVCYRSPPPCPMKHCDEDTPRCFFSKFLGPPGQPKVLPPLESETSISLVAMNGVGDILAFGTWPYVWRGVSWEPLDLGAYAQVVPVALNEAGLVLGNVPPAVFSPPLLWEGADSPYDLNTLIPEDSPYRGALYGAYAINARGDILCQHFLNSPASAGPILLRRDADAFDLSIHSIEWGQTLFKDATGQPYPLVSGKPFFVRVFVKHTGTPPAGIMDWDVALTLSFFGFPDPLELPIDLLNASDARVLAPEIPCDAPLPHDVYRNEHNSFNFLANLPIPDENLLLSMTARVNKSGLIPEATEANNTQTVSRDTLNIMSTRAPSVVHLLVDKGNGSLTPSDAVMGRYEQIYPVSAAGPIAFLTDVAPDGTARPHTVDCTSCPPRDNQCCYNRVADLVAQRFAGAVIPVAVGWFAPDPRSCIRGGGTMHWRRTILLNSIDPNHVAHDVAHELGHLFVCVGDRHNGQDFAPTTTAPCALKGCGTEDPGLGFVDELAPPAHWPLNMGANVYAKRPGEYLKYYAPDGSLLNSLMFGINHPPRTEGDCEYRGGCGGKSRGDDWHWIKRTEFRTVLDSFGGAHAERSISDYTNTLAFYGTWDTGDASLQTSFLFPSSTKELGPFARDGELTIRLFTSLEQKRPSLDERIVVHSIIQHEQSAEPDTELGFRVVIPERLGEPATLVQRVQITESLTGKLFLDRRRTPNAPQLMILHPAPGSTLDQETLIEWKATDQDGDSVLCMLGYLPDPGRMIPLTSASDVQSYRLYSDSVPGSEVATAALRVTCSDGMNIASAQVVNLTNPLNHPPRITLIGLSGQQVLSQGTTLIGRVLVHDSEDVVLPDESIVWSSDIDGLVDVGTHIMTTTLSVGTHVLTVSATDSGGLRTDKSVTVEVRPATGCDRRPSLGVEDIRTFVNCLLGPEMTLAPGCECLDSDRDRQITLRDFQRVQIVYNP